MLPSNQICLPAPSHARLLPPHSWQLQRSAKAGKWGSSLTSHSSSHPNIKSTHNICRSSPPRPPAGSPWPGPAMASHRLFLQQPGPSLPLAQLSLQRPLFLRVPPVAAAPAPIQELQPQAPRFSCAGDPHPQVAPVSRPAPLGRTALATLHGMALPPSCPCHAVPAGLHTSGSEDSVSPALSAAQGQGPHPDAQHGPAHSRRPPPSAEAGVQILTG